jgi:hypothetical protein
MILIGLCLSSIITLASSSVISKTDDHIDVVSAGFVRSVGEWFGLPNPIHLTIYIVIMIVLVVTLLILMCYGINCVYVMLFILLALLSLALFLIIWYWIGINPEDIPDFTMVKETFNGTKIVFPPSINSSVVIPIRNDSVVQDVPPAVQAAVLRAWRSTPTPLVRPPRYHRHSAPC